jgi:hypothetical protein
MTRGSIFMQILWWDAKDSRLNWLEKDEQKSHVDIACVVCVSPKI